MVYWGFDNESGKEAFKSFAVTMACLESSRTGRSVWVPAYWKDMPL
jgi:hypothetical protein